MSRLLLISVSAGNGHVRAAQALAAAAGAEKAPDAPQVTHLDAMQFVASGFRKAYTDGYLALINRYPDLWSYLHRKTDNTPHTATSQKLRRAVERLSSVALLRAVRRHDADAIVCTHFLPAELLLREQRQGRLACPIWMQVTDYDLHNMWLVPELAGYFAATPEVAHRMRAAGLPADRIHITGIPVMPAFSERGNAAPGDAALGDAAPGDAALGRNRCAARLGLDAARPVVLMASGGAGVGDLPAMVERALGRPGRFQIISVAGRNEAAKQALDALAAQHAGRLLSIGFTSEMHTLMAAADLVVTKPGGLTISECLALGRPMLLVSPIPGQEQHNAGYLMEEGAAWLAYDAVSLEYKLQRLMSEPAALAAMASRSAALGKPHAARDVLAHVLHGGSA
jgi:processive 1,2-diacylglycerol beta-glucosyltransferase